MLYDDFLDDKDLQQYVNSLNARAQTYGITSRLTVAVLRDRILESGGKCEWCTRSIVRQSFEIDHIISLNGGGQHTADNLAVSCPDCNRRKSAKHPARFAQETVSQTGLIPPLIQRVLDHYGVEARKQQSLFAEDEAPPPPPDLASDNDDDPPPYIWGKN